MGKLLRRLKTVNHRYYIVLAFFIALLAWSIFHCRDSYIRVYEAARDFGTSFLDLLFFNEPWCPEITVTGLSSIKVELHLPQTWVDVGKNFDLFIELFFDLQHFLGYLIWILPIVNVVNQLLCFSLLFALLIFICKKVFKPPVENDVTLTSRPLKIFLNFRRYIFLPVGNYLKSILVFFFERKYFVNLAITIFVFSTNFATVIIAFFAFYFYFCGTFDVFNIPVQIYKLFADMIIGLSTLPLPVWLFIAALVFDYLCRKFAFKRLLMLEACNKTIVKLLGLITLIIAPMRGGKTKLESSMSVTKAQIMREDALDNMLQVHSHFPHFPFERFISVLNGVFAEGKLKSLRLCEQYVAKLYFEFSEDPTSAKIFGYDFERYPMNVDNGLVVINLFEDLSVFVKSFSVYSQPTLFIGNYSVRELHKLTSEGNFPIWDFNLFNKPSFDGSGQFSYQLNFDILRPGKKVGDDPKIYGLLEYGVLQIQEADKEFGNKVDMEEMKISSKKANMKNDLHNKFFKTMGHSSMINYKSFIQAFMDSQRADSLGADSRQLGLICKIEEMEEMQLTLSFFSYRDMLYRLFLSWHKKFTSGKWFYRADRYLLAYLVDSILTCYIRYCERIYNTFGYQKQHLQIYEGVETGEKQYHIWYALNKKDKGGLYATDGLVEMFRRHNARSGKGIEDLNQYRSLHPSLSFMEKGNSFMINQFVKENSDDSEGGS